MKIKRVLSLVLALIMALALAVPAMAKNDSKSSVAAVAVDKIEDTMVVDGEKVADPRLPLIEAGAPISTSAYPAIYIKQANDIAILVHADDARSDAEIIAEAAASDKSLAKQDKGTTTVIRGDGSVWLHKNETTLVTVANGILTVMGPISHIDFTGAPAPDFDVDDGTVSAVFQITKYVNGFNTPGAGFTFEVLDANGEVVAEMTSDEYGTAATDDIKVLPGMYTIRETGLDLTKYEAVADIEVEVDENGQVVFPTDADGADMDYIINYELGALDVTAPTVKQKYDEVWHKLEYAYSDKETRVSKAVVGGCIVDTHVFNNGFTALKINKAALATAGSTTVQIAMSDKPGNTPCADIAPAKPWENPTPATYTIQIVSNQVVVTSNLPNFGIATFAELPEHNELNNSIGGHNGVGTLSCDMPEGEEFWFYIHYEVGYETSTITGCDTEVEYRNECTKAYEGKVTVTVTNAAGEEVTDLTKLPHGEYTVTVTAANGEKLASKTEIVNPGKTAEVAFDTLILTEKADDVLRCPWCTK